MSSLPSFALSCSAIPTPALRTAYAFNRLEDRALEQILPYVSEAGIALSDVDELIQVLQNAFADPDAAATAREKLHSLKKGNKEFSSYFAEFQMLIAELDWDQNAKMDALREGLSIELHEKMIGLPPPANFAALAALCQQLDSQIRAVEARRKRRPAGPSDALIGRTSRRSASAPATPVGGATAELSNPASICPRAARSGNLNRPSWAQARKTKKRKGQVHTLSKKCAAQQCWTS